VTYTTVVISRDGEVHDLGKTERKQITFTGKDNKVKTGTLIRAVEYPSSLVCPPGGTIQNPQCIPYFAGMMSQTECDKLKKMSKVDIKKRFGL
jgi:hypothetical protein